ncbi:transposase [Streptomyces sp. NPDC058200]|uniref:transposase n=1 Tax=Streptomyces sp. NPDC058200 TaxID=3346378 RepID=UPI0036E16577
MPKPYPEEFREDVVRVARNRGPGVTVEQVAADFGVHAMTLWKWMRRADVDAGTKPGTTGQESTELREARRRIKLLAGPRYGDRRDVLFGALFAQASSLVRPLRAGASREGLPCRAGLERRPS